MLYIKGEISFDDPFVQVHNLSVLMKQRITAPNKAAINTEARLRAFGFTLVETMVTVGLFLFVVAGSLGVYVMCQKYWQATLLDMQTGQMASLALSKMVNGVGTNSGLRAASSLVVCQASVYGHPYPFLNSYKYWENTNSPPSATDPNHYVHLGCAYGSDGSWRLIVSNPFEGVRCFDYNSEMRNILFCPDTNQTTTARSKRILICNYVSNASVATNSEGVNLDLTVWKRNGIFMSSNRVSAFIKMRNN